MHYRFYSTEDFIQDEFFQQWVYFPNEENNQFWSNFLSHYPMQRKYITEAREFLLAMNFDTPVPESMVQRIKVDFNSKIDAVERMRKPIPFDKTRGPSAVQDKPTSRKIIYAVSACILSLALFAGFFVIQNDTGEAMKGLAFETQKTHYGRQRHIILADGTEVWLNANSALRYAKNFAEGNTREVYLEGEAFFDVFENAEKPFIVYVSGLAVRVLGTQFNVRSYASDEVIETTLVKGKVSIVPDADGGAREIILRPNQQALFSKHSKAIALENSVDAENYAAWRNGWMIFDNRPFNHIKETLERRYDVRIIMEDKNSLSCTFSGKFKDKTLQEVLEIFKSTESISYRIDGDKVYIQGKLCRHENPNEAPMTN